MVRQNNFVKGKIWRLTFTRWLVHTFKLLTGVNILQNCQITMYFQQHHQHQLTIFAFLYVKRCHNLKSVASENKQKKPWFFPWDILALVYLANYFDSCDASISIHIFYSYQYHLLHYKITCIIQESSISMNCIVNDVQTIHESYEALIIDN